MRKKIACIVAALSTLGLNGSTALAQIAVPAGAIKTAAHGTVRTPAKRLLEGLYSCNGGHAAYITQFHFLNAAMSTTPPSAGFDAKQAGLYITSTTSPILSDGDIITAQIKGIGQSLNCAGGPFFFFEGTLDGSPFTQLASSEIAVFGGANSNNYFPVGFQINTGATVTKLGILTTNGGTYYVANVTVNGVQVPINASHHTESPHCMFGTDLAGITEVDDYCGN